MIRYRWTETGYDIEVDGEWRGTVSRFDLRHGVGARWTATLDGQAVSEWPAETLRYLKRLIHIKVSSKDAARLSVSQSTPKEPT